MTSTKFLRATLAAMVVTFAMGLHGLEQAQAQFTQTFNFEQGEGWPNSGDEFPPGVGLNVGDTHTGPGGVDVTNGIGNPLYFDDNDVFTAPLRTSNGGPMVGQVMWGAPSSFGNGDVLFEFYSTPADVLGVAFDFGWATGVGPTPTELYVELYGTEGYYDEYIELDTPFFTSGVQGYSGHINLTNALLNATEDFGFIQSLSVYVDGVSDGGTFAIDNFAITYDDASIDNNSQLSILDEFGSDAAGNTYTENWLKSNNHISHIFDLVNSGSDGTAFEFTNDAGFGNVSGHALTPNPSGPGFLIDGDTTLVRGAGVGLNMSTVSSGIHSGNLTVSNVENALDADDITTVVFRIYDPAQLAADTATPINLTGGGSQTLEVENANADVDGLRAAAQIISVAFSKPGYTFTATDGTVVDEGETVNYEVAFNPEGLIPGNYNGTLTLNYTNRTFDGSGPLFAYIGTNNVDPIVWNLIASVSVKDAAASFIGNGESFAGKGLFINSASLGASLVGGVKSTAGSNVSLSFVSAPPPATAAQLIGGGVELTGSDGDLFVLQLNYDESLVVEGEGVTLLVYDEDALDWVNAVLLNSDGGAGANYYAGAYADYLTSVGRSDVVAADLSTYGYDPLNNFVWAVLDHNSLFATGLIPEPASALLIMGGLAAPLFLRRR